MKNKNSFFKKAAFLYLQVKITIHMRELYKRGKRNALHFSCPVFSWFRKEVFIQCCWATPTLNKHKLYFLPLLQTDVGIF